MWLRENETERALSQKDRGILFQFKGDGVTNCCNPLLRLFANVLKITFLVGKIFFLTLDRPTSYSLLPAREAMA